MVGEKLVSARKKHGWSIIEACDKTLSVKPASLSRIESGEADGKNITVSTMMQLIELYWPDLKLSDFTGDDVTRRGYKITRCAKSRG